MGYIGDCIGITRVLKGDTTSLQLWPKWFRVLGLFSIGVPVRVYRVCRVLRLRVQGLGHKVYVGFRQ